MGDADEEGVWGTWGPWKEWEVATGGKEWEGPWEEERSGRCR